MSRRLNRFIGSHGESRTVGRLHHKPSNAAMPPDHFFHLTSFHAHWVRVCTRTLKVFYRCT